MPNRPAEPVPLTRAASTYRMATRRAGATIEFTRGDAATIELPAGSFDAVISRFGMMLFDDTEAAFAHLGRLVRPGGRIACVTWTDPVANEWFALPYSAAGPTPRRASSPRSKLPVPTTSPMTGSTSTVEPW